MLRRFLFRRSATQSRDQLSFDLVIVGGGPAGLSCAIMAKQMNSNLSVCLLEKGSEVGSHILSGNVFEPRALNELLPDWRSMNSPVTVPVREDHFYVLPDKQRRFRVPSILFPKQLHNEGNYIISLGALCKWLAQQAESLGVEIYPGFSVSSAIIDQKSNRVIGVSTKDTGVGKSGEKKSNFSPGMDLLATKGVVLAEGARGSVTEQIVEKYSLRSQCPPTYSLGLKEVWSVDPSKHREGTVCHAVGFPVNGWSDLGTHAGSFLYHGSGNLVYLGLVVGLDYSNAYLNMHDSLQELKRHVWVKGLLEGGRCVSYGARVLNASGIQGLPGGLSFPGGVIVGCGAGFLNFAKIKGTHTAMKSGMVAAETLLGQPGMNYEGEIKKSWVYEELLQVRNLKPMFKKLGMLGGLAYAGSVMRVMRGREPWTLGWAKTDSECTKPIAQCNPILYPKPDNVLTFDILDSVSRTGVKHEHDQPSHLVLREGKERVPREVSFPIYGGPESRFCPAKVYEYVEGGKLQVNAQNCIHCKSCAIKTPEQFIRWTVPEGGGGPQYSEM